MPLTLTEEQTMLRDSARQFLAHHAPVAHLRRQRHSSGATGFSRPLWRRFAQMGYCGILVPEALGGVGLGMVEAGLVLGEIGRNLSASPFLASSVMAVAAIRRAGTEEQQSALLPALASGERIGTLAVDEHRKHRPLHVALKATPQVKGFELNGSKNLVLDGHVADLLIVAARTSGVAGNEPGITLFAVDRQTQGIAVERVVMVDARPTARIEFKHALVPAGAVLGAVDAGAAALRFTLDAGCAAAASELLGIADEAFARTMVFLKERRQFDHLIGEFQALQHRAAVLYCDIELARAAVCKALLELDTDAPGASAAVSVAKARAGSSATLAVQEGVQMHGGMGMTDEFDMGLFMKRARVLQELWGDANFHAGALARQRYH